jgi:EXLDI family protein
VLLGEWGHATTRRVEDYKVYRTRTGKFAVYVKRSPEVRWTGMDAAGWRERWGAYLGLGEQSWGHTKGEATLEVVDSLEALREKIPPELYEMVATMAEQPAVEDLDI